MGGDEEDGDEDREEDEDEDDEENEDDVMCNLFRNHEIDFKSQNYIKRSSVGFIASFCTFQV